MTARGFRKAEDSSVKMDGSASRRSALVTRQYTAMTAATKTPIPAVRDDTETDIPLMGFKKPVYIWSLTRTLCFDRNQGRTHL